MESILNLFDFSFQVTNSSMTMQGKDCSAISMKKKFNKTESLPPNKRKCSNIEREMLNKQVTKFAPKNRATKKRTKGQTLALITPPDLSIFAICWIKIRGFKDWPGVIESHVNGGYSIHFFGDYSTAVVSKKKNHKFL